MASINSLVVIVVEKAIFPRNTHTCKLRIADFIRRYVHILHSHLHSNAYIFNKKKSQFIENVVYISIVAR